MSADVFGIFVFITVIAPANSAVYFAVVGQDAGFMNVARSRIGIGAVTGIVVITETQQPVSMRNFIL